MSQACSENVTQCASCARCQGTTRWENGSFYQWCSAFPERIPSEYLSGHGNCPRWQSCLARPSMTRDEMISVVQTIQLNAGWAIHHIKVTCQEEIARLEARIRDLQEMNDQLLERLEALVQQREEVEVLP